MVLKSYSKFETRLKAVFGVALVVFVALAVSAWLAARQAAEAMFWVNHTHDVLEEIAASKVGILLAELNGQRYRLTGDAAALAARDAAIAAREPSLRRLQALTADNPRQQALWAQLRAATDERLAIWRRAEELHRTAGPAAANAYLASTPLAETRERLFGILQAMAEEEHRLLQAREAEQTRVMELRAVLTAVALVLLAALLAATYVMIRHQLADRARAEAELQRLNASLEEASRAKSDFLANMSHELRTPLNSIIGFSEMLKDGVLGELDEKQRGFVTDIYDAGTHLLSLINDILDLSKVESGMLELEAEPVDLPALLKASTLVVRQKAIAHRIRLDTRIDPALGTVLADERKVKQIVYNLLANAVKFTPEGGSVLLAARRVSRAQVGFADTDLPSRLVALPPGEATEFLEITVEDSGMGIAEADLARLFEPFTQVDGSLARRHSGTGLGLALVRRLAELHGGTVGVASRPGVGSVFRVWLPYRDLAGAQPAPAPQNDAPEAVPVQPLALVIEDDDRMADLIAAQLSSEGFAVIRAATAEEGLVRAAKCRPDLITLDIFLPHMDGWECMRRLKADPNLAETPVVIITVSGDLARGLALGARRVLQKPFAPGELAAAVTGLVAPRDRAAPCVLVVDDNVKAVEQVATTLEAEGYRVLRAYSGAEAIAAARRERPDLLILDLMMPEVSGFEVARALRESEQTARIPILVLTTGELGAAERARLNAQVGEILAKADFNRSVLLAELRRALPGRGKD